jgi:hypothetical protein
MRRKVLNLLFAPGSGGNWLIHTINNMPLKNNGTNFHQRTWTLASVLIEPTHHVPAEPFLFFQGNLNLNFFLNSIYKYWFKEKHAGNDPIWFLNKMLRNWSVIVNLSQLDHKPDFDWHTLLHDPDQSHAQLLHLQNVHAQTAMSSADFLQRRQAFFNTMVSTSNVYQNWDNELWVLAVLADAKYQGVLPESWQFESQLPWSHYRDLAITQFENCKNISYHDFGTTTVVPGLKQLTSTGE